ncbi:DUF397 domain-containing protein [Streptomyces sp. NRRL F-5135]|uniref:DUF397 domain-containing protein n=1 Tax=Streptomyces sp. NRRL F-5135 TaxID=1463858 RepID=UPI000AA5742B|nr:DUF397 domain-containing protein [Streptomyces sp. NRRL F-5135]
MTEPSWQTSSYCAQGEACLNVATTNDRTVILTESADPDGAILSTSPATWAAFLQSVKETSTHHGDAPADVPAPLNWIRAADNQTGPGPWIEVAMGPGDLVRLRETSAPGPVVTTTRAKWEAFVQGVLAGEFDHFAERVGGTSPVMS